MILRITVAIAISAYVAGCAGSAPQAAASDERPARAEIAQGNIVNLWAQKPSDAELKAAAVARDTNSNRPVQWWSELANKPDSFFQSEEGRRIAENILSWQERSTGGWPLMNTTRELNTGDPSKAGPWGMHAALIKATVNEMRFLARGYRATQDTRYQQAVIGGLNFILSAQHRSGGWPHSFPLRMNDYSHYATFNDDMMPDLMTLLQEVATAKDFECVGKEDRQRAVEANRKGLEFILKSQLRSNGKLTAWAQQYDEQTYEPKPARAFEPVAISGGESASVLFYLMSLPKPSPEVIAAVEAGVQWYRDSQINGLKLTQTKADRVVTADANAPPIWARFYDIATNKPLFAGRDGVIRDNLADIEQERRGGYAWYNYNGTKVFQRYAIWKSERAVAGPKVSVQPASSLMEITPDGHWLTAVRTTSSNSGGTSTTRTTA